MIFLNGEKCRILVIMFELINLFFLVVFESNLGWIFGVNVVFYVLVIVFVGLRIYMRIVFVKIFGRDDVMFFLVIVSLIILIWIFL